MRANAYSPSEYTERVNPADVAEWVNADPFTRHTATEEHGLWSVEVGPGETRQRVLEAGTHRYRCEIHPSMRGTFAVTPFAFGETRPVEVDGRTRFRRYVRAIWAPTGHGGAYDVQRRRTGRRWGDWRSGTTATEGAFRAKEGERWKVRARLRGEGRATDWSPAAVVRLD